MGAKEVASTSLWRPVEEPGRGPQVSWIPAQCSIYEATLKMPGVLILAQQEVFQGTGEGGDSSKTELSPWETVQRANEPPEDTPGTGGPLAARCLPIPYH